MPRSQSPFAGMATQIEITKYSGEIGHQVTEEGTATVSPKQYVNAIAEHSQRATGNSIYPGQTFVDLASMLQRGTRTSPNEISGNTSVATLYTMDASDGRKRRSYYDPQECVKALRTGKGPSRSYILFLRGMPTSDWLAHIGALCHTDPEFFNSHLRFRWRRNYFSYPAAPAISEPIIRIRFTTIGSREIKSHESDQKSVDQLRVECAKAMRTYESKLEATSDSDAGDSIVRSFTALDEKHFILEQELSICLNYVEGNWIALVLTDAGRDLSEGLLGPWLTPEDRDQTALSPWTIFYPTIQHRPRIALRTDPTSLLDERDLGKNFAQSARLQALDYGNLLNAETMRLDPFYAISDLFYFYAHSETQFLNLMEVKIASDTDFNTSSRRNPTLSNLRCFQDIIDAHLFRLRSTTDMIKERGGAKWPRVSEQHPEQQRKADASANALQEIFKHLTRRAESLLDRCTRGMDLTMNDTMLAESKQAIAQAQRITRLTLVAFFYIPLSFTTSFFGMNFAELEVGLSIWIWHSENMEENKNEKTQPWKAFKPIYQMPNRIPKAITYNYAKGQTMAHDNPGTAGEFNLSIEYDTGDAKEKYVKVLYSIYPLLTMP
ncbi:hypothetical protein V493_06314 [Pseudogymnoascus sp. VKM F-4281 (FW-2241)]|nr:hypothetical protein V493_06314 [Pseudogymnoascus sp. VKM F-4281 (FW-2241)]